jgi:hypothetical protein
MIIRGREGEHPDIPVEMMVIANEIPRERKLYPEIRLYRSERNLPRPGISLDT